MDKLCEHLNMNNLSLSDSERIQIQNNIGINPLEQSFDEQLTNSIKSINSFHCNAEFIGGKY